MKYHEKKCDTEFTKRRGQLDGAHPTLSQEQFCTHTRILAEVSTEIAWLCSALLSDRNGEFLFALGTSSQCTVKYLMFSDTPAFVSSLFLLSLLKLLGKTWWQLFKIIYFDQL